MHNFYPSSVLLKLEGKLNLKCFSQPDFDLCSGLRDKGFEDLLGNHGFTKKDEGPKTIGDMKKKTMAEEMDPIKLKVDIVFNVFRMPYC